MVDELLPGERGSPWGRERIEFGEKNGMAKIAFGEELGNIGRLS